MKVQYKLLSYSLDSDIYGYGGTRPFASEKDKCIRRGDFCNTFTLNFKNHAGTHLDCPYHFYNSGKKVCQYQIKNFVFLRPFLLDCPKAVNELITEKDVISSYEKLKKADILLLRTGFYKRRGTYEYSNANPGISPDAARFIRLHLGNIKCVGIDSISVSPYQRRELGRETHRIFFKNVFKNAPVLIIEDMDLSGKLNNLRQIYVFPLFIKNIDSSPCTVLGVLGR